MTQHYSPYHLSEQLPMPRDQDWGSETDFSQYGVRIGGSGGRLIGRELQLNREQAVRLCELLEAAREAGRQEGVEG